MKFFEKRYDRKDKKEGVTAPVLSFCVPACCLGMRGIDFRDFRFLNLCNGKFWQWQALAMANTLWAEPRKEKDREQKEHKQRDQKQKEQKQKVQHRNEEQELKKKRMILFAVSVLTAACMLVGCGKDSKEEDKKEGGTDQFAEPEEGDTYARINIKDFGTISVRFFEGEAPLAVENFVTHAKEGYYDGVTFHRVIDDFMIQGGDPDGTGFGGESIWGKNFADEFSDGLHPFRGALCMANTGSADTNGSQFFIVQAGADSIKQMEELLAQEYDLTFAQYMKTAYKTELTDEQVEAYRLYGGTPWLDQHHTVFGQVLEGYDVLDAVAAVQTDADGAPIEPVVIESIEILEY